MTTAALDRFLPLVRDVPDFPRPGIVFKDITPLIGDPEGLKATMAALEERARALGAARVVGIESRGFIFGAALADRLGVGFAPVRKLGKLPYKTDRVEYELEYGSGTLEAHVDAVKPGERVLVVDDLLATGGTAWGAGQLVVRQGGTVAGYLFVIELGFLGGRKRLDAPVEALIAY
jgi:adenine phosphoribosyltransferase